MQGLWYGDKRDRVKWGALVHLAKEKNIFCIVQVAYFRHGPDLKLQINECEVEREVELSQEVWDHFSDLRHIERLGGAIGKIIVVLDHKLNLIFDPYKRDDYIGAIVSEIKNPKIVSEMKNGSPKIFFLDPDTGIEPEKAKHGHVKKQDIEKIWRVLSPGDLLVVYQHADRTKKWRIEQLNKRKTKMSSACDNVCVKHVLGKDIASDVAMLWCLKDLAAESVIDSEPIIEREPPSKTTEAAPKPGTCPCGCGEKPRVGAFVQGHDGRVSGWILQIERKGKKASDFPAHISDLYHAWVLAGKPGGNQPRLKKLVKRHQDIDR
jgi:hypothetical protein